MAMAESCPVPEQWQKHLQGSLSAAEHAVLVRHLDQCPTCQQTLEQLATGSGSWPGAAAAAGETGTHETALHQVLEQLKHQQHGPETCAAGAKHGDVALDFLTPSDQPGSLGRLGRYEMLEVVGSGGMGVVLKAHDENLRRIVAVKVMAPALAATGTARKRFVREAHATAAVRNDHVIYIHEVDDRGPIPYLVMEFVAGMTLQQKLDQEGPLPVKEILRIGLQIAEGLAAAHKQGLVHRDIKPSNILLENGVQRVKITDFGLARAVDDASLTQSGVIAGTPQYMAPEQAAGEAVDHRADLFSLGSVLYTMCTGHAPFRASGNMAVMRRVVEDTPRPIREINPDIADWLAAIIARLHAKKKEDRFQSAREVADLMGQCLAHVQQPQQVPLPEFARGFSVPAPALPVAAAAEPDNRWLMYGSATLALLVAVVSLWFPLSWQITADQPGAFVGEGARVVHIEIGVLRPLRLTWESSAQGYWLSVTAVRAFPLFLSVTFTLSAAIAAWYTWGQARCLLRPQERTRGRWVLPRPAFFLIALTLLLAAPLLSALVLCTRTLRSRWYEDFMWGWFGSFAPVAAVPVGLILFLGFQAHFVPRAPGAWPLPNRFCRSLHFALGVAGVFLLAAVWVLIAFDVWASIPGSVLPDIIPNLYTLALLFVFVFATVTLAVRSTRGEALLQPSRMGWLMAVLLVVATVAIARWTDHLVAPWEQVHASLAMVEDHLYPERREVVVAPANDTTEPGWVQLVNKKDLTGWKSHPKQPGKWVVKDGVLSSNYQNIGHLFSDRNDYQNFHLTVEASINDGGLAGVHFHVPEFALPTTDFDRGTDDHNPPDKVRDHGMPLGREVMLNVSWKGIAGFGRTGSLAALNNSNKMTHKTDEWFVLEIIAQRPRIITRVNGETVIDHKTDGTYWPKGHLVLGTYGSNTLVKFRKIEIKELPPSAPDPAPVQAPREWHAHKGGVTSLSLAKNGRLLLSHGEDQALRLWDLKQGKLVKELTPETSEFTKIQAAALHPQGEKALIGAEKKEAGRAQIYFLFEWLFAEVKPKQFTKYGWPVKGLCYTPGGDSVIVGFADYGGIQRLDATTYEVLGVFSAYVTQVGDSVSLMTARNGFEVMSSNREGAFLWDNVTRKLIWQTPSKHQGVIPVAAVSPDGKTVLTSRKSATADVWNLDVNKIDPVRELKGHTDNILSMAFAPDSLRAATGSRDRTVRLWEVASGKELGRLEGHTDHVTCLCFLPDGNFLVSGARDGNIRVWKVPG